MYYYECKKKKKRKYYIFQVVIYLYMSESDLVHEKQCFSDRKK